VGNAYVNLGDYPRAYEMLEKAYEMFKELGDTVSGAVASQTLAQLCVLPQVGQAGRVREFMLAHCQSQAAMSPAGWQAYLDAHR
jgi:hypothetical protein